MKNQIIDIEYSTIKNSKYIDDAIINDEFIGFKEDYLIIHYLIKKWKPNKIFEIGTSAGNGCKVMQNASPSSIIITLDIHPCGQNCPINVTKIVADSMQYNYIQHYPIDCWFIDGCHTYTNVFYETKQALLSDAKYIIYHDADIPEVLSAIIDGFNFLEKNNDYNIFKVINPPYIYSSTGLPITRIVFAEKK